MDASPELRLEPVKRLALALTMFLAAGRARASADTFGVGDGHSGDLDLSACSSAAYVNEYTTLSSITPDGTNLTVGSALNFASGDLVMVWQPAGMAPASVPSGAQTEFAFTGLTGAFELARVSGKTATTLTVSPPMINVAFANRAQVVRVPEFRGLKVGAACMLVPGSKTEGVAKLWDGATGGIVAFLANDAGSLIGGTTIDGTIHADGTGFQGVSVQFDSASTNCGSTDNLPITAGGSFRGENVTSSNFPIDIASGVGNVANGGGGGNCSQSGGGGGGHGGKGGAGGLGPGNTSGGKGGAPVASRNIGAGSDSIYGSPFAALVGSLVTHFTFGGAGGHGQTKMSQGGYAGRGGGVVWIRANHLAGAGTIHANGGTVWVPFPTADGQAGGGAGGTVIIRVEGALGIPCANIQAKGGAGGNTTSAGVGAGGGGAGGRVLVQASNACTSSVVGGGVGGTVNAVPNGGAGAAGSRETLPGGIFCPDGSASSDSLCVAADAARPHCNSTFNFCAECNSDAHCTDPNKPVCDSLSGVCTCSADKCPPTAPVCNAGAGTCTATCDTNGGDSLCSARFGANPGDPRFCDLTNGAGKKGQCVACQAGKSAQCPVTLPVCTNDVCGPCSAGTPESVCAIDHFGLVCNSSSGQCVECMTASTCTGANGCVSNVCTACSGDPSCTGSTGGRRCKNGSCVECVDDNDCPGGSCQGSTCVAGGGDAGTGSDAGDLDGGGADTGSEAAGIVDAAGDATQGEDATAGDDAAGEGDSAGGDATGNDGATNAADATSGDDATGGHDATSVADAASRPDATVSDATGADDASFPTDTMSDLDVASKVDAGSRDSGSRPDAARYADSSDVSLVGLGDEGGCSCRMAGSGTPMRHTAMPLFGLALLLISRRRRGG
jgi:MYXO-CTERM domain-containing protein